MTADSEQMVELQTIKYGTPKLEQFVAYLENQKELLQALGSQLREHSNPHYVIDRVAATLTSELETHYRVYRELLLAEAKNPDSNAFTTDNLVAKFTPHFQRMQGVLQAVTKDMKNLMSQAKAKDYQLDQPLLRSIDRYRQFLRGNFMLEFKAAKLDLAVVRPAVKEAFVSYLAQVDYFAGQAKNLLQRIMLGQIQAEKSTQTTRIANGSTVSSDSIITTQLNREATETTGETSSPTIKNS